MTKELLSRNTDNRIVAAGVVIVILVASYLVLGGREIPPTQCETDQWCMEEHESCFAVCVDGECRETGLKPPEPCTQAVWNGYPGCSWGEEPCIWQPTTQCPMTCDQALNMDWGWAGLCNNLYDRWMHASINYQCGHLYDNGFVEMLCKCGICGTESFNDDRYSCSEYI